MLFCYTGNKYKPVLRQLIVKRDVFNGTLAYGGDQGTFTEVKQRQPWLVLGWVTVGEDRAL